MGLCSLPARIEAGRHLRPLTLDLPRLPVAVVELGAFELLHQLVHRRENPVVFLNQALDRQPALVLLVDTGRVFRLPVSQLLHRPLGKILGAHGSNQSIKDFANASVSNHADLEERGC